MSALREELGYRLRTVAAYYRIRESRNEEPDPAYLQENLDAAVTYVMRLVEDACRDREEQVRAPEGASADQPYAEDPHTLSWYPDEDAPVSTVGCSCGLGFSASSATDAFCAAEEHVERALRIKALRISLTTPVLRR